MLRDLSKAREPVQRVTADVVIIGAGIAGLIAAKTLTDKGLRVAVLESGGERQDDHTHPLNQVVQLGQEYAGASHGRFRALGGTSTRWGGALIPFQQHEIENGGTTGWPVGFAEFARYQGDVEKLFGLPAGSYEDFDFSANLGTPLFLARAPKWPRFAARNVAHLIARSIKEAGRLDVWLDATVNNFELDPSGRLSEIGAVSSNGYAISAQAPVFIFAAGAIESTRLLLILDRATGERLLAPYDVIGRYLHDHLSVASATLLPYCRPEMNRLLGFRFEAGGMRNIRFETSAAASQAGMRAGFVHVSYESQGGGFNALRSVAQRLQRRSFPSIDELMMLASSAPWVLRALWWRLAEQRLLFPDDARLIVHTVVEQAPLASNRITLSTKLDRYGQPLAAIDWKVSKSDIEALLQTASTFNAAWNTGPLSRIGHIQQLEPDTLGRTAAAVGGIYHPGGTTRMAKSKSEGVLDASMKLFGMPNVYVCSTAAFPTGGASNPTMMLAMAALRMADDIGTRFHS